MNLKKVMAAIFVAGLTVGIYAQEILHWKDLKPLKNYSSQDYMKLLGENTFNMEMQVIETKTRKITILSNFGDVLVDYKIPKVRKSVKRLLVVSEPISNKEGEYVQYLCIDSLESDYTNDIYADENYFYILGQTEYGEPVLIASIPGTEAPFTFKSLAGEKIDRKAFRRESLYLWNPDTKTIKRYQCMKNGEIKIKENKRKFDNPLFFRLEGSDSLYVTETDENFHTTTGEFWLVDNLVMSRQESLVKF